METDFGRLKFFLCGCPERGASYAQDCCKNCYILGKKSWIKKLRDTDKLFQENHAKWLILGWCTISIYITITVTTTTSVCSCRFQVVVSSVAGETLQTRAPSGGVKLLMSKMSYSDTIGKDTDGDGELDTEFSLEVEDSETRLEFPLGFCPGDRSDPDEPQVNFKCIGEWGFVVKEWETVTKTYPRTAKNLNKATKQVDCDVYDPDGNRVDVSGMRIRIDLTIGRMRNKDPAAVAVPESHRAKVDVGRRAAVLKKRGRVPVIYHAFNVSIDVAALTLQVKLGDGSTSREHVSVLESNLVAMVSSGRAPKVGDCEFARPVRDFPDFEGLRSLFVYTTCSSVHRIKYQN